MLSRLAVIVAAVVLVAVGPAEAGARSRPLVTGISEPNPTLSLARGGVVFDDSVIYGSSPSGKYLIKLKVRGKPAKVLATIVPKRLKGWGWPSIDFGFVASDQVTVVGKEESYSRETEGPDEELGPFHETLAVYAPGGRELLRTRCLQSLDMALSGSALAYITDCGDERGFEIRDFAEGGRIVWRFAGGDPEEGTVRVAGDVVAYSTDTTPVTVANWRTGPELYRVERPGLIPYAIDVARDGTLVGMETQDGRDECYSPVVFGPSERSGRVLPASLCGPDSSFRLIGHQLAFVTRHGAGAILEVLDIDSGALRTVAKFARRSIDGFDFDGRHVAWQERRCQDYAIFRQPLSAPARTAGTTSCPIRLGRGPVHMTRRGKVDVPFRCPRGCTIEDATLSVPGIRGPVGTTSRKARPGQRAKLHFITWPPDRPKLRRRGPTSAQIAATSYLPGGARATYRRKVKLYP